MPTTPTPKTATTGRKLSSELACASARCRCWRWSFAARTSSDATLFEPLRNASALSSSLNSTPDSRRRLSISWSSCVTWSRMSAIARGRLLLASQKKRDTQHIRGFHSACHDQLLRPVSHMIGGYPDLE
eukprot:230202-Rhodomonas_salina.2